MEYLEGEASWDPSFDDESLYYPEFEDPSWYAAVAVDSEDDTEPKQSDPMASPVTAGGNTSCLRYNLVQACCAKGNHLHKPTKVNRMCDFIDITIDDDFTSPKGRKLAIDGLRGPNDTIFFTGPCTGGSKWTQFNAARGGKTLAKIERRREVFWGLWDSFLIVAKHAIRVGARILIELPRGCSYWRDARMTDFLDKHGFSYADFDGCMYGLVARHGPQEGHPINKPWRIACLNSTLNTVLSKLCNKGHSLPHTRCGG